MTFDFTPTTIDDLDSDRRPSVGLAPRSGTRGRRLSRYRIGPARAGTPHSVALEYRLRRRVRSLSGLPVDRALGRNLQRPPDGVTGAADHLYDLCPDRHLGRRGNDSGDDVLRPRVADPDGVPARHSDSGSRRRVLHRVLVDDCRDAGGRVRRNRGRTRRLRAHNCRCGHLRGVRG